MMQKAARSVLAHRRHSSLPLLGRIGGARAFAPFAPASPAPRFLASRTHPHPGDTDAPDTVEAASAAKRPDARFVSHDPFHGLSKDEAEKVSIVAAMEINVTETGRPGISARGGWEPPPLESTEAVTGLLSSVQELDPEPLSSETSWGAERDRLLRERHTMYPPRRRAQSEVGWDPWAAKPSHEQQDRGSSSGGGGVDESFSPDVAAASGTWKFEGLVIPATRVAAEDEAEAGYHSLGMKAPAHDSAAAAPATNGPQNASSVSSSAAASPQRSQQNPRGVASHPRAQEQPLRDPDVPQERGQVDMYPPSWGVSEEARWR